MKCPTCRNENKPEARFCGICGTDLSSGNNVHRTNHPKVGFGKAISLGFKNYFKFNGRATRAEYWWFILFYFLISLIPVINWFTWIVFLIPTVSLTTRRLHDIGKTGWWQLWYFLISTAAWGTFVVALIVGILTTVFGIGIGGLFLLAAASFLAAIASTVWFLIWLVRQGETGPNKYGLDPRIMPKT